jgi:hypothetical protein
MHLGAARAGGGAECLRSQRPPNGMGIGVRRYGRGDHHGPLPHPLALSSSQATREYDGTTAAVRTEHLSADGVEFLRWRVERWMKLRHMPAAFADSPIFLLRNAPKMFAHTFRGSTIRSFKTSTRGFPALSGHPARRARLPVTGGSGRPSAPWVGRPRRRDRADRRVTAARRRDHPLYHLQRLPALEN